MISFKIGEKEIHNITLEISRGFGTYKISVNGNIIKKGFVGIIGTKEHSFDVGQKEKHNIKINVYKPLLAGIVRYESKVFVDNKHYETYKL